MALPEQSDRSQEIFVSSEHKESVEVKRKHGGTRDEINSFPRKLQGVTELKYQTGYSKKPRELEAEWHGTDCVGTPSFSRVSCTVYAYIYTAITSAGGVGR